MKTLTLPQIRAAYDEARAIEFIRAGFIAYTMGEVRTPPAQQFYFPEDNGDCCVKSAWSTDSDCFAVKISTGFYENAAQGLPSNNGMILLFSARTGAPEVLLLDNGWLTATRTALAGRIAAEALRPRTVHGIGIYGTGLQAELQLRQLVALTGCRDVLIWGRSPESLAKMRDAISDTQLNAVFTTDAEQVARESNLIVTATASRSAIVESAWISPDTHITAVGADAPGKQELSPDLIARAAIVVVDSAKQCSEYGEISHARTVPNLTELGGLLAAGDYHRPDGAITIADLTGLGVQDLQIARSLDVTQK